MTTVDARRDWGISTASPVAGGADTSRRPPPHARGKGGGARLFGTHLLVPSELGVGILFAVLSEVVQDVEQQAACRAQEPARIRVSASSGGVWGEEHDDEERRDAPRWKGPRAAPGTNSRGAEFGTIWFALSVLCPSTRLSAGVQTTFGMGAWLAEGRRRKGTRQGEVNPYPRSRRANRNVLGGRPLLASEQKTHAHAYAFAPQHTHTHPLHSKMGFSEFSSPAGLQGLEVSSLQLVHASTRARARASEARPPAAAAAAELGARPSAQRPLPARASLRGRRRA